MTIPTTTGAPINILVIDDESNIRKTLAICLEAEGHHVTAVSNFQDAVAEASRRTFHMAFVDLRLGTASGMDLIPVLLSGSPWMKIVVITAYASIDTAEEAMRREFIEQNALNVPSLDIRSFPVSCESFEAIGILM
jgi:two-component system, NtrC family, response regulator AlgB